MIGWILQGKGDLEFTGFLRNRSYTQGSDRICWSCNQSWIVITSFHSKCRNVYLCRLAQLVDDWIFSEGVWKNPLTLRKTH